MADDLNRRILDKAIKEDVGWLEDMDAWANEIEFEANKLPDAKKRRFNDIAGDNNLIYKLVHPEGFEQKHSLILDSELDEMKNLFPDDAPIRKYFDRLGDLDTRVNKSARSIQLGRAMHALESGIPLDEAVELYNGKEITPELHQRIIDGRAAADEKLLQQDLAARELRNQDDPLTKKYGARENAPSIERKPDSPMTKNMTPEQKLKDMMFTQPRGRSTETFGHGFELDPKAQRQKFLADGLRSVKKGIKPALKALGPLGAGLGLAMDATDAYSATQEVLAGERTPQDALAGGAKNLAFPFYTDDPDMQKYLADRLRNLDPR